MKRILLLAGLFLMSSGIALGQVYTADFSTVGGFEHTSSNVPAAGPQSFEGANWTIGYDTAPTTDGSLNYFRSNGTILESDDWGGEANFETDEIDISSLSTFTINTVAATTGGGFNSGSEYLQWYYVIDGGSAVTGSSFSGTGSLNQEWASISTDGGSTLVIGFDFNMNGGSAGFEVSSVEVTGTSSGDVVNPTSENATVASSTQIDLSWTENDDTDNVLLAFNTSSSFGDPTDGVTYSASDDLSGATVLQYSGTDSFSHTGLSSNTTYYYKIWSYDGSEYSSGVEFSATTLKEEPSEHVSGFSATEDGSTQIDLSWTDAAGTVVPDGYLIKVSTTSLEAISDPVDETAESDDTDISDGSGALNVSHGTGSASFTGLTQNTQYFFKIYSYANSGSSIDYKTDGSIQSDDATTEEFSSSIIFSQYIDTDSGSEPKGIEVWNISGSTIDFSTSNLVINRYANGSSSPTTEATISSGTLLAGDVLVVGGSTLSSYMSTNFPAVTFINDGFSFNGDDAMELTLDGARQDVFGEIGIDPGTEWSGNGVSTSDQNIELKLGITSGTANGFSDPSTRFQLVEDVESGSADLTGFGLAPGEFQLTGSAGFRMLTSPTEVSYNTLLDPIWTQGATGADVSNGDPNVFTWPNVSDGSSANWVGLTDLSSTIDAGTGMMVYVYDDDDFDGAGSASWPKTLSVSGTENSADISPTMNTHVGGYTLVGNPFASTIDFDDVTTNALTDVAYVWDGLTWKSYTKGGAGDITDGLIKPFQGFFVENDTDLTGGINLTFSEASKSSGGTFYGKTNSKPLTAVRFQLDGEDVANSMWMQFTETGTIDARVKGDALELEPLSHKYAQLGVAKEGRLFDIVNLPLNVDGYDLPIGLSSSESGDFSLRVTRFEIPDGLTLVFHDYELGFEQEISKDFTYNFELHTKVSKSVPNPLTILKGPAAIAQKSKSAGTRFGITITPNTTSIGTEPGAEPTKFALDQNYPNPFNPSTTITYSVENSGLVTLSVYNLMGQKIAELVNETKASGSYNVTWNASGAASGMYYYRLEAGGQTMTRKMTLIK